MFPGSGARFSFLYYIIIIVSAQISLPGNRGMPSKPFCRSASVGDVVAHLAIVELLIGHHVKVAGAGQAKDDGLFLAGLLALEGLVDGGADGVAALGGGQDALSLVWVDFITSLS